MRVQTVEAKSLLTKSKLPDADYVINPYIGCNHGCVYCYAEFMSRFTGHSGEAWGDFIDVKQCSKPFPPPDKLAGKSVLIGSATDPYNPLEKQYEKTRGVLIGLRDTGARVEVLTKSPLVLRDLDILRGMKSLRVGISLASLDEAFARLTERHAASPQQRLDTMRRLSEAGIAVYAFISPIFPFFSDWRAVADEAGKYADYTCFENLNLRGGYRRAVLDLITASYPERAEDFGLIFKDRKSTTEYWRGIESEIHAHMAGKAYKVYLFHGKSIPCTP